jgi:aerobic-type carbon monoxide dehydrogenase small subunit (CoxS/CutS family)
MLKVKDLQDRSVFTLEGLNDNGQLHPLQESFIERGAIQCGFCTSAQILTAKAFLDKNPSPSEEQVRTALRGVLCRCTGYVRIVDGVMRAAARLRGENWTIMDRSISICLKTLRCTHSTTILSC